MLAVHMNMLTKFLEANAGNFIYIFYGTLDKPTDLPPKGEFFCSRRDNWMPEVPGKRWSCETAAPITKFVLQEYFTSRKSSSKIFVVDADLCHSTLWKR